MVGVHLAHLPEHAVGRRVEEPDVPTWSGLGFALGLRSESGFGFGLGVRLRCSVVGLGLRFGLDVPTQRVDDDRPAG